MIEFCIQEIQIINFEQQKYSLANYKYRCFDTYFIICIKTLIVKNDYAIVYSINKILLFFRVFHCYYNFSYLKSLWTIHSDSFFKR